MILSATEAYPRWARTYDAENAISALECDLVEELGPSPRHLQLLDVGCGTGRRLRETGAAFATGVEPCTDMLAAGRSRHSFDPAVRLIEGDARALPLPGAGFDLVWCRLVIGHIAEGNLVYRELCRVTAPGGHVIVTDFHSTAHEAGHRRTFRDGDDVIEVCHYSRSLARHVALAEEAGLMLGAHGERAIGPQVEEYYVRAGKRALYQRHVGLPVVLGIAFRRDA